MTSGYKTVGGLTLQEYVAVFSTSVLRGLEN